MPVDSIMWTLTAVETLLWIMLGFTFWRKDLHKRFPAMGTYVFLRVVSIPALLLLLYGGARHWFGDWCYILYTYLFWALYAATGVILYFIAMEIFRAALSPFSGLVKFGTVIFRWAAVASLLIGLSSINFARTGFVPMVIFYRLMRSVSILELCLLAFLCLAMNALRLSARDISFGIALGFGVQSAGDFIGSALWSKQTSFNDPQQYISEVITLLSIGVWVAYSALPERKRNPVVVPATSTIYRWNEIASALGHKPPTLAVQQPANSFFLTDVEKVVEKVLAKNMKESESNS